MLRTDRIEFVPANQEVVVDEADDVKAIRDGNGVGKVRSDDGAVHRRQIHTDDADLRFALQSLQIGVQRQLRATENDVVDLVVFRGQKVVAYPCGG